MGWGKKLWNKVSSGLKRVANNFLSWVTGNAGDKARDDALNKMLPIIREYNSYFATNLPNVNLYIPPSEADIYANEMKKAKENSLGIYQIFRNPIQVLFSIASIALSIVGIIVTLPIGGWIGGIALAGSIAGLIGSIASFGYSLDSLAKQNKMNRLLSATSQELFKGDFKAWSENLRVKSQQISNFLIYTPSMIFANGSLYKSQAPGSETFRYTQAHDSSSAMRGEYKNSEIDDITQNRSQIYLAGGSAYHSSTLNIPLPIKEYRFEYKEQRDSLNSSLKANIQIANNYFNRLIDVNFGVNHNQRAQNLFNDQNSKIKNFFINKIVVGDALDKSKTYNFGLRYQMPIHKKDYEQKNRSSSTPSLSTTQEKELYAEFYLHGLIENMLFIALSIIEKDSLNISPRDFAFDSYKDIIDILRSLRDNKRAYREQVEITTPSDTPSEPPISTFREIELGILTAYKGKSYYLSKNEYDKDYNLIKTTIYVDPLALTEEQNHRPENMSDDYLEEVFKKYDYSLASLELENYQVI